MRHSTQALIASIVVLAAVAIWFALEKRAARDDLTRTQVSASHSAASQGKPPASPRESGGSISHPDPRSTSADQDAQARAAEAEAMRAQLEDPATREKILNRQMELYGTDTPDGFTRYVGLNDDEYLRLMNLLTDQQLELFRARYECAVAPNCDDLHVLQTLLPEQRRALQEMLGPERKQRHDNFLDTLAERAWVENLRSTLPDSQPLTGVKADQLIDALGEERRQVIREIEQRGSMYSSVSSRQGMIVFPITAESLEQKYDEAQAYQRRLSRRAGQFLNAQQLSVFNQLQTDWLAKIRSQWAREAALGNKR